MGQLRQTFEKFISAPPFEKPIDRRPDSSAWPGNYTAMDVSLAWHAFCAGYRSCLEKTASEKTRGALNRNRKNQSEHKENPTKKSR